MTQQITNRTIAANLAAAMRGSASGSHISARTTPTDAPNLATLLDSRVAVVNGRSGITQQRASVSYLPENRMLQIPAGLFQTIDSCLHQPTIRATHMLERISAFMHGDAAPNANLFRAWRLGSDADEAPDGTMWAGPITTWSAPPAPIPDQEGEDEVLVRYIDITLKVGEIDSEGQFAEDDEEDDNREVFLVLKYGPQDEDEFWMTDILTPEDPNPSLDNVLANRPKIAEQLSDHLSAGFGLNYSVTDMGRLNSDVNRFTDQQWSSDASINRFDVRFTAYTLTVIAGLNLAAVNGEPQLAWVRAYVLAMGFLPIGTSLHNAEYQVTEFLPEHSDLAQVVSTHAEDSDSRIFPRRALSVLAVFGALHMANNHTFKSNDLELKRKAIAYVLALRTVYSDETIRRLQSDALLETTVRTTCHCFGLASGWGALKLGQRHNVIAEPLKIRTAVVPPPIAKVGLCVSIMTKACALPIGDMIRQNYGEKMRDLERLRTQVVANAAAYSELHKHYGIDTQRTLTTAEIEMCESLLPLVSAYADVFERRPTGEAIGAALSQIVRKCLQDQSGLVSLYAGAFTKYVEDSPTLQELLDQHAGKAAKTP